MQHLAGSAFKIAKVFLDVNGTHSSKEQQLHANCFQTVMNFQMKIALLVNQDK